MLLFPCAVSRLIKGLKALSINSSTRVTLASEEKLCISDFQGLAVLSLRDPLLHSTQECITCYCTLNSAQCASTFQCTNESICPMLMSGWVSSEVFSRIRFQWFVSDPPCSSFKRLILLTLRLLQGLRMMSLAKAVPDGIKDNNVKGLPYKNVLQFPTC